MPRGGEGKASLRSMPDYAPAFYVAIMSQIRGSLSLHPSLQPTSALPVACTYGGCQKAAGSRQPGELVMLRCVVPPAGSAQYGCRPGISCYRADGTARRAPATLSPPAEAVTAVDIPPIMRIPS